MEALVTDVNALWEKRVRGTRVPLLACQAGICLRRTRKQRVRSFSPDVGPLCCVLDQTFTARLTGFTRGGVWLPTANLLWGGRSPTRWATMPSSK